MNLQDLHKVGQAVFELFDLAECDTSRQKQHFFGRAEGNLPMPRIQRDPFSHFVVQLGRDTWLNQMREKPDRAAFLGYWAGLLLDQQLAIEGLMAITPGDDAEAWSSFAEGAIPRDSVESLMKAMDSISLASRRMVVLYVLDVRNADPGFRRDYLLVDSEYRIPSPSLSIPESLLKSPGAENELLDDAEPELIEKFLRTAQRIQFGWPVQGSSLAIDDWDRGQGVVYEAGDEVQVHGGAAAMDIADPSNDKNVWNIRGKLAGRIRQDTAYTRFRTSQSRIEPAALLFLQRLTAKIIDGSLEHCEPGELLFFMMWSLQLLHGLEPRTCRKLGLNGNTNSLSGYIEDGFLVLRLGVAKIGQPSAWNETVLKLPLAPECAAALAALLRHFPEASELRQCKRPAESLSAIFSGHVRRFLQEKYSAYQGAAKYISKVWVKTGLKLNIPSPDLGLCRGHTIPGGRGEAPYRTVRTDRLIPQLFKIQHEIRELANVDIVHVGVKADEAVHGTIGIDLKTYFARTIDAIGLARAHNDTVALIVRLMRGLGFRKMGGHVNPFHCYRLLPLPMLVFRDKVSESWVPERYVPLSPALQELVIRCGKIFGDAEYLTYAWEGNAVRFDSLPEREQARLRGLMSELDQYNAGRTAFFNALLKHDIGEALRQIVTGHGSVVTHPLGQHQVLSMRFVLELTNSALAPLYAEEGIDQCADALRELLGVHLDSSVLAKAAAQPFPFLKSKTAESKSYVPEGVQAPLTFAESRAYEQLIKSIEDYAFGKVGPKERWKWPRTGCGLMGLIALRLGIPLSALIAYQQYYSFDSFVIDHNSGRVFFLLVGGHHDAGGLYRYPVFVCNVGGQTADSIMQTLAAMYGLTKQTVQKHREKDGQKLDETQVVQLASKTPLFGYGKRDELEVGRKLKFLLQREEHPAVDDRIAFKTLERFSQIRCTYDHPAVIASNLTGRNQLGANHYDIPALLRFHLKSEVDLRNLDGQPWIDRLSYEAVQTAKKPIRTEKCPSKNAKSEQWAIYFRSHRVTPSSGLFRRRLISEGLSDWKAGRMANVIMGYYRREGWLHCSRPLPLFRPAEFNALMEAAEKYFAKNFKALLGGRKASRQKITNDGLRGDFVGILKLVRLTKMRPRETFELSNAQLISVGKQIYVLIKEGKTDAAPRLIHLNEIALESQAVVDDVANLPLRDQTSLFPYLRAHYDDPDSPWTNLGNTLKRITGQDTSIYDVRHAGIVFQIYELVQRLFARGNFWFALSSFCTAVGHASIGVTLNTYLGTAVWVIEQGLSKEDLLAPLRYAARTTR